MNIYKLQKILSITAIVFFTIYFIFSSHIIYLVLAVIHTGVLFYWEREA